MAFRDSTPAAPSREPLRLTPREAEVVDLVFGKGLQLKEAGGVLGICKGSVCEYLGKIYRKMGVDSNVRAMKEAIAYGIVPVDPRPEGFVIGYKKREYIQH